MPECSYCREQEGTTKVIERDRRNGRYLPTWVTRWACEPCYEKLYQEMHKVVDPEALKQG